MSLMISYLSSRHRDPVLAFEDQPRNELSTATVMVDISLLEDIKLKLRKLRWILYCI